jgi:hypothetical protein
MPHGQAAPGEQSVVWTIASHRETISIAKLWRCEDGIGAHQKRAVVKSRGIGAGCPFVGVECTNQFWESRLPESGTGTELVARASYEPGAPWSATQSQEICVLLASAGAGLTDRLSRMPTKEYRHCHRQVAVNPVWKGEPDGRLRYSHQERNDCRWDTRPSLSR